MVKQGTRIVYLIQVAYDLTYTATKEREGRTLIRASVALDCDDLVIINHDIDSEELFT